MYESAQGFVGDLLLCAAICAVGMLIAKVADAAERQEGPRKGRG